MIMAANTKYRQSEVLPPRRQRRIKDEDDDEEGHQDKSAMTSKKV